MEVIRLGQQRVISHFDLVVRRASADADHADCAQVGDLLQFSPGAVLPTDGLLVFRPLRPPSGRHAAGARGRRGV